MATKPRTKAETLARLVPIVSGDLTLLDLVLGRLLALLDDPDPSMMQRILAALAVRNTSEPAGGAEAGVA